MRASRCVCVYVSVCIYEETFFTRMIVVWDTCMHLHVHQKVIMYSPFHSSIVNTLSSLRSSSSFGPSSNTHTQIHKLLYRIPVGGCIILSIKILISTQGNAPSAISDAESVSASPRHSLPRFPLESRITDKIIHPPTDGLLHPSGHIHFTDL